MFEVPGTGATSGARVARSPENGSAAASAPTDPPPVVFGVVGDFGSGGTDPCADIPSTQYGEVVENASLSVSRKLKEMIPSGQGFVVSLGDQVYQPWTSGGSQKAAADPAQYAQAIGPLYSDFIDYTNVDAEYQDPRGPASDNGMRFYPVLGDHDWWKQATRGKVNGQEVYYVTGSDNYESYFAGLNLPATAPETVLQATIRYYDVVPPYPGGQQLVHLFALSNDPNEVALGSLASAEFSAEAATANLQSPQIQWFIAALGASNATWNIAFMHYPPFTTASQKPGETIHNSAQYFQFFDQMPGLANNSIDLVLAGHVHGYERLIGPDTNQIPYLVNGAGGTFEAFATFCSQDASGTNCVGSSAVAGGQVQITGFYGFQVITATDQFLNVKFLGTQDPGGITKWDQWGVLDNFFILKPGAVIPVDALEGAMGIQLQGTPENGPTIDTGGEDKTIAANLYGPGRLTVTGGGTLTFVAPSIPPLAAAAMLNVTATATVFPTPYMNCVSGNTNTGGVVTTQGTTVILPS